MTKMKAHPTPARRLLSLFPLLTLLTGGLAAVGCGNIIGVSGLDVTTGAGGGKGGHGGSGGAGGTRCVATSCAPHYDCDATGEACSTTCDALGGCAADSVCFLGPKVCRACGSAPPPGPCPGVGMGCDACDASTSTCVLTCDTPGTCAASRSLPPMIVPVRLECGDACDDITVSCNGAAACEVVCDGGCNGLHLDCSVDGACSLLCNGTGCVGAIVTCGGNSCDVACKGSPVAVQQACGNACSCTKSGCQ
jgi:hypothetical protein